MYIKCKHCDNNIFIAELENNMSAITRVRDIPLAEIEYPVKIYCSECNTEYTTFKNKLDILFYSKTIEQYLQEI